METAIAALIWVFVFIIVATFLGIAGLFLGILFGLDEDDKNKKGK